MNRLQTFSEIYKFGKNQLAKSGVESVNSELLNIFWYCFSMERGDIILKGAETPSEAEYECFCKIIEKRCSGMPLQYAIGKWEFMGIDLSVGEGVLIPREDTTVVVESGLKALGRRDKPKVIDLCSGSGCIALTLEKKLDFDCEVYAVEVSDEAFKYLQENCEQNGSKIKLINDDITVCHKDFEDNSFDLIISNPPYIESEVIKDLQPEVLREPRLALDGGTDGLMFYRSICEFWVPKLKTNGILAFEIGQGQFESVANIMQAYGIAEIEKFLDINSIVRAVVGKKGEV